MIQYSHEEQPPPWFEKKTNYETSSVDLLQVSVSDIYFFFGMSLL